ERNAAEARAAARRAATSAPQAHAPQAPQDAATPPASAPADDAEAKKKAIIQAALERARRKKAELAEQGVGPRNVEHVSADVQAQIDEAEARRKRIGIESNTSDSSPDDDKSAR
ncbi:MAG TPA: electron transport complex subunit RsxB, partial [Paraburkholderia sp.]|nr:electron transport complex subunit RsxB [Paraburkholderia sp.]